MSRAIWSRSESCSCESHLSRVEFDPVTRAGHQPALPFRVVIPPQEIRADCPSPPIPSLNEQAQAALSSAGRASFDCYL
jgi:hypothetical protein